MRRLIVLAAVVALVACTTHKKDEQSFLDQVGAQTKEQIMARGDALAAKKKWEEARKFYSFLSDTFPNDPLGRRAALKVADTFFAVKDTEGYTEAELRYKDFANRFPSDPNRPYALLMLAKCSFAQRKGPLRDLTPERQAVESLRKVLQLYPSSPYAAEAKVLLDKCLEDLAMHELLVAKYYANVDAWVGVRQRLDYLFDNYPDTSAAKSAKPLMDKALQELAKVSKPAPTPAPTAPTPAKH
jgi:outer membrane protein assembly factor BamD